MSILLSLQGNLNIRILNYHILVYVLTFSCCFCHYSEDENTVFASSLVLRLFHQALPFLKHDVHEKVEGDVRIFQYTFTVIGTDLPYNNRLTRSLIAS